MSHVFFFFDCDNKKGKKRSVFQLKLKDHVEMDSVLTMASELGCWCPIMWVKVVFFPLT